MGRNLSVPAPIKISKEQKSELHRIATARSTPLQISKRASVLRLVEERTPYSVIAKEVNLSLNTVKKWRRRWDEYEEEINEAQDQIGIAAALFSFLQDKSRSGQPKKFTETQVKQIVALACDKPINHGLEMTNWTYEMLAHVAQEKNIVANISKSHVRFLLKNTAFTTA
jgi:putative transposase